MSSNALLTFHLTTETNGGFANLPYDANVDIHAIIRKQTITLKAINVVCSGTGNTLVYLDTPWLGAYNLVDGVNFMSRLPILLDASKTTTIRDCNISLDLQKDIEERFRVRLVNRDGSPASNIGLVSATFQFQVKLGKINS